MRQAAGGGRRVPSGIDYEDRESKRGRKAPSAFFWKHLKIDCSVASSTTNSLEIRCRELDDFQQLFFLLDDFDVFLHFLHCPLLNRRF